MRNTLIKNFIVVIIIIFSAVLYAETKGEVYYSWIHRTRVRSAPDMKWKGIAFLNEWEKVVSLGEVSKNKIKITLRGEKFNTPFYKVKLIERETLNGKGKVKTGWVYGGALKKLSKIIKYDNIIKKIEKLHESLSGIKENKKFDIFKISKESIKGKILYKKLIGRNDCTSRDEYILYYQNGSIEYDGMGGYAYLLDQFPEIKKGVKPGVSKNKIKKILGSPMRENKNILTYANVGMSYETGKNEYFECAYLYFKNNKLFAIYITSQAQPC